MKLTIIWILFLAFTLVSCFNPKPKETSNSELYKPSHKELLKDPKSNQQLKEFYDSTSNLYSNYYYHFSFRVPKNWEFDKGVSEHTVIRAYRKDSAYSVAINILEYSDDMPTSMTSWDLYDKDPVALENSIKKVISRNYQIEFDQFSTKKSYIHNQKALRTEYVFTERHQDLEYEILGIFFQVLRNQLMVTVGCTLPKYFYDLDPNRFNAIINEINFLNIEPL